MCDIVMRLQVLASYQGCCDCHTLCVPLAASAYHNVLIDNHNVTLEFHLTNQELACKFSAVRLQNAQSQGLQVSHGMRR